MGKRALAAAIGAFLLFVGLWKSDLYYETIGGGILTYLAYVSIFESEDEDEDES